jgi:hypothetical protein
MIIKTPQDWWTALDTHWANLLECFGRVGAPLSSRMWSDDLVSAPVDHPRTLAATLEQAKTDRDEGTLIHYLNQVWICAPDKPYIHEWPSWHVLCDLCSEGWVFDPEV